MVVGVCGKENDLLVNVMKGKQLTNVRASGSDENIQLTPPIPLTLEYAMLVLSMKMNWLKSHHPISDYVRNS